MARGIPIGAVPGSIRSATSEGTNALLGDGAFPVCSAGDILVALSLAGAAVAAAAGTEDRRLSCPDPSAPGEESLVFDALRPIRSSRRPAPGDRPDLPALCGGLERLAQAGLARDAGGWWERA